MAFTFNADEIFEIAEQIERNGAKFYRQAADKLEDGAVKGVLLGLATMEDTHEKRFAAMHQEIAEKDFTAPVFDPDNQAGLYLQSVADGKVFDLSSEPAAILKEGVTAENVLEYAIGIEKESVIFYNSMKGMVPPDLGKIYIDAIILEEIGHIITLRDQIEELGK